MSIYDNEIKIYPDLNHSAPQELQAYQLQKLTEIETFFLDETEVLERIAKKMKRFNTIAGIVDTGLITSTVITGGISIAALQHLLAAFAPRWCCLRRDEPTSFPCNGHHMKIFQDLYCKTRKTQLH